MPGPIPRTPTCHPERQHLALGLCSPCWRRQYRRAHPITDEQNRRYRAAERAKYQLDDTRWFNYSLKRRYGIDRATYDAMLAAQGGVCAICGSVGRQRLAVDHDHRCCPGKSSCGKCVRALLCGACNSGLANFADDPVRIARAANYVADRL